MMKFVQVPMFVQVLMFVVTTTMLLLKPRLIRSPWGGGFEPGAEPARAARQTAASIKLAANATRKRTSSRFMVSKH